MPEDTVVDQLFRDYNEILNYLDNNQQLSYITVVENNFRKAMLLAVASFFEHEMCRCLQDFAKEHSKNAQLVEFVKNKAIEGQYFKFFNWNSSSANNANEFFTLFGEDFLKSMKDEIKKDDQLQKSIIAFLTIGQNRNYLVHNNYAAFTMELTSKEIYELYQKSLLFIGFLPDKLKTCGSRKK